MDKMVAARKILAASKKKAGIESNRDNALKRKRLASHKQASLADSIINDLYDRFSEEDIYEFATQSIEYGQPVEDYLDEQGILDNRDLIAEVVNKVTRAEGYEIDDPGPRFESSYKQASADTFEDDYGSTYGVSEYQPGFWAVQVVDAEGYHEAQGLVPASSAEEAFEEMISQKEHAMKRQSKRSFKLENYDPDTGTQWEETPGSSLESMSQIYDAIKRRGYHPEDIAMNMEYFLGNERDGFWYEPGTLEDMLYPLTHLDEYGEWSNRKLYDEYDVLPSVEDLFEQAAYEADSMKGLGSGRHSASRRSHKKTAFDNDFLSFLGNTTDFTNTREIADQFIDFVGEEDAMRWAGEDDGLPYPEIVDDTLESISEIWTAPGDLPSRIENELLRRYASKSRKQSRKSNRRRMSRKQAYTGDSLDKHIERAIFENFSDDEIYGFTADSEEGRSIDDWLAKGGLSEEAISRIALNIDRSLGGSW